MNAFLGCRLWSCSFAGVGLVRLQAIGLTYLLVDWECAGLVYGPQTRTIRTQFLMPSLLLKLESNPRSEGEAIPSNFNRPINSSADTSKQLIYHAMPAWFYTNKTFSSENARRNEVPLR